MSPRQTIKIRIAVSVAQDGHWSAAGWGGPLTSGSGQPAVADAASDLADLTDGASGPSGLVWVEAEIPLPEPVETIVQGISGPVEEAGHANE